MEINMYNRILYFIENKESIEDELEKCKKSPFYFATKYMRIKDSDGAYAPFLTRLSEKEFNKHFEK